MITNSAITIRTKNLSVGYPSATGQNVLFSGINLALSPGKLTCFMGPNGIGKSTLIATLAGLHTPLAGDLTKLDAKSIALVLTDKITSGAMRVFDLVSYGRYPYLSWGISLSRNDVEIINKSIDEANIRHLADKKLDQLSDGQMQLAMIARALAQETPVLLLDEPTAHLDLNNRVEIMKLLHRLAHEKNKAILVATHELDLALQMADHIWLATPDKKIKTGIPEDLVLDGSFDEIFQFKGFDLKTGKVQHESHQNTILKLVGEGFAFLWTKNALEREGFSIGDQGAKEIHITQQNETVRWTTDGKNYSTITELLAHLTPTATPK